MRSIEFDQRVTLQTQVSTEDAANQKVLSWTDLDTVWARVRFLSGREFAAAGRNVSEAVVTVRIRFRLDVTANMRVLWDNKTLDIKAVLPDASGHREYIDLPCATGVNNG